MQDVERCLDRAVRRLAEQRGEDFQGRVTLHCSDGRLQSYEINERHKSTLDKTVQLRENGSG